MGEHRRCMGTSKQARVALALQQALGIASRTIHVGMSGISSAVNIHVKVSASPNFSPQACDPSSTS